MSMISREERHQLVVAVEREMAAMLDDIERRFKDTPDAELPTEDFPANVSYDTLHDWHGMLHEALYPEPNV